MKNSNSMGVLIDIPRCIACRSCMVSCKSWNDLPARKTTFSNNWDSPSKMDSDTWTNVTSHIKEEDGKIIWRFVKRQCMHCNEPSCESACFTRSFVKTEEGAVIYKPTEVNKDYCVGCRYCQIACPFDIVTFQWEKAFPFVQKCRFCYDRMKEEGLEPACVTSCPTGALKYGKKDELLAEAWGRINNIPGYVKHVYGEKEYGGTSWFYISDVPFEEFGFKVGVIERSIPSLTWDVLKWTPHIAIGWGAILTGLYYYTKRRSEISHEEADDIFEPVGSD